MSEGDIVIEQMRELFIGHREVNFSNNLRLVAVVNSPEPTIRFQKNNEILFDLKSFAPEGTIIKFDNKEQWAACLGSRDKKHVLIMGKFKGVSSVLDFLHECGHLQDFASTDLALTAKSNYFENFSFKRPDDYSSNRLKSLSEKNEYILHSERNAWAFALKKARFLEQKHGIEIFKQMGGINGVLEYVNGYVSNYEKLNEQEYSDIKLYSKKQIEKLLQENST